MKSILFNKIDEITYDIAILKKTCSNTFTKQFNVKLEVIQKYIKIIKKQIKEYKIGDMQGFDLYSGFFEQSDIVLREVFFQYRLTHTDFQAIFLSKEDKIPNFTKMDGQLLINTSYVSIQLELQFFSLQTICEKTASLLHSLPYSQTLKIPKQSILRFVKQVCYNYNILPYHNFTHAFSVFVFFYECSQHESFKGWFNELELFYSLIACLCHDISHHGKNTLFQTKCKSNLAIDYHNQSVLQKMHLSKTLTLLQKKQALPQYNTLPLDEKNKAKRIISRCILATDMSKHYNYVTGIKQKQLDRQNVHDRQYLSEVLIHASDIGNPCMNFNQYIYWANLICMEFNNQTKQQQSLGIEVTEFMKFNTLAYFHKNQLNFVNSVVLPLWQELSNKHEQLKKYVDTIKINQHKITQNSRRNSTPNLSQFELYLNQKLV